MNSTLPMARSLWKGSISFGLVNIPINLFTATESHRVGFHELDRKTHARIHYRRVSEASGDEVPWEQIDKGFEVRKGHFVILTEEELEAAEPRKSHNVEVEHFVPLADIDPVNWDQTYYVAADGEAAAKAYDLLRQAMEKKGRVAIGRFVLRTKEYVVCIRPLGKILALQTMFFPDEVRDPKDLGIESPKASAGREELALAERLIDLLAADWDPHQYKDTFTARIKELVRKKDRGEDIAVSEPKQESGEVIDLMAALKATLEQGRKAKAPEQRSTNRRASEHARKTGRRGERAKTASEPEARRGRERKVAASAGKAKAKARARGPARARAHAA